MITYNFVPHKWSLIKVLSKKTKYALYEIQLIIYGSVKTDILVKYWANVTSVQGLQ